MIEIYRNERHLFDLLISNMNNRGVIDYPIKIISEWNN